VRCQLRDARPKVCFVGAVVPLEHGARLVTRQPHGDAFRHASTHQIANGRSPEIMNDATNELGPGYFGQWFGRSAAKSTRSQVGGSTSDRARRPVR